MNQRETARNRLLVIAMTVLGVAIGMSLMFLTGSGH